jgi:hypothetical protein
MGPYSVILVFILSLEDRRMERPLFAAGDGDGM